MMLGNGYPPWAFALPLNSPDFGTSRWQLTISVQVFGRRYPRCQPRAPAAGVRKAPRHEVAGSWALAGSEPYGDFDMSADLVCGREADTPSASVGVGRDAATRIADRFHNFRVSA